MLIHASQYYSIGSWYLLNLLIHASPYCKIGPWYIIYADPCLSQYHTGPWYISQC